MTRLAAVPSLLLPLLVMPLASHVLWAQHSLAVPSKLSRELTSIWRLAGDRGRQAWDDASVLVDLVTDTTHPVPLALDSVWVRPQDPKQSPQNAELEP